MDKNQIALQLYTVREAAQADMLGTLRRLADMGYRAVEFAGYGGVPTREIRAVLDERGMTAMGAHVGLHLWQEDTAAVIRDLQTLGCTYAIVPFAGEEYRTAEGVGQLADRLNALAGQCRAEGLRFAYHNHAFEFAPLDGGTMWERLVAATDPALVNLELDVFWAQVGGAGPVALIEQLKGRVPILHIKDMAGDASQRDMPVGDGVMPWDHILPVAQATGIEWYVIEQDHPQQPLADVERSLHGLEKLLKQA
jgi:sugar phosphate isomerase/epimerase